MNSTSRCLEWACLLGDAIVLGRHHGRRGVPRVQSRDGNRRRRDRHLGPGGGCGVRLRSRRHAMDTAGLPQGNEHGRQRLLRPLRGRRGGHDRRRRALRGRCRHRDRRRLIRRLRSDARRGLLVRAHRHDVDAAGLRQTGDHAPRALLRGHRGPLREPDGRGVRGEPDRQGVGLRVHAKRNRLVAAGDADRGQRRRRRPVRLAAGDRRRSHRRRGAVRGRQRDGRGRRRFERLETVGGGGVRVRPFGHHLVPGGLPQAFDLERRRPRPLRRIALEGDTPAIGAQGEQSSATGIGGDESSHTLERAGAVYLFARSGGTWTQWSFIKASNTGARDAFGSYVALSGDTIVASAPGEDSGEYGMDGDQTNDLAFEAGAVYVFR